MSTNPRDWLELRRDAPTSEELRKLATSIMTKFAPRGK